jgi:hypothetical protein
LEIGFYLFETSKIFSKYFNKYCPDGQLITTDIAQRTTDIPSNVYPVLVYPHDPNVEQNHSGLADMDIYYKDWKNQDNTIELNTNIIKSKMKELNIDSFDFVFIDGGHTEKDISSDLQIVLPLMNKNGYILLDDITDGNHELTNYYINNLRPKNDFFEFENWKPSPIMGLIKAGDLKL